MLPFLFANSLTGQGGGGHALSFDVICYLVPSPIVTCNPPSSWPGLPVTNTVSCHCSPQFIKTKFRKKFTVTKYVVHSSSYTHTHTHTIYMYSRERLEGTWNNNLFSKVSSETNIFLGIFELFFNIQIIYNLYLSRVFTLERRKVIFQIIIK